MQLKVYAALAAACHTEGPNTMFGLVGDGNVKFADHWRRVCQGGYVAARHENGAVSMAVGYARAGDCVGLVTLTQGPGLTNALTALTAAARARVPMILVTGLPPSDLPGHPQSLDHHALMAVAGVGVAEVRPASLRRDVFQAFAQARQQRRPVAIALPTDIQDLECQDRTVELHHASTPQLTAGGSPRPIEASYGPEGASVVTAGHAGPSVTIDVEEAAEHLMRARRPVLVAGRGALESPGAREAIERLADRTGALLATTLPARGFFSGHPYAIGVMGGYASSLAVERLGAADCVVTFGASLNYRATQSGTLLAQDAVVVQCDTADPPEGASVAVHGRVVADAADAARALGVAREWRDADSSSWRTTDLARRLRLGEVHERFEDQSGPGAIDPRTLMLRLDGMLPRERSVTVDGGHSSGFPSIYLNVPDRQGYLFALEFAAIGLGLGNAIGAAIARPERLSVLVVGDGSFLMSLPDLETAAREQAPLLVVVMNDRAYGSELHILAEGGLPPDLGLLDVPDLARLAEAIGATGHRVRDLSDLERLPHLIRGLRGPLVVDCEISRNVKGPWMRGAFARALDDPA